MITGILFFALLTAASLTMFFHDWNNVEDAEKEMQRQMLRQERTEPDSSPAPTVDKSMEETAEKEAKEEKDTTVPISDSKKASQYRYINGCPLSRKIQRDIKDICDEANLSFELVMSHIWKESGFDPLCVSDDGESKGLMQIQEKWHRDIMEELDCTDLYDPVQNVRVGVELLRRHFRKWEDPAWALMAYNGGQAYAERMAEKGEISKYAKDILRQAEKYEKENGLS